MYTFNVELRDAVDKIKDPNNWDVFCYDEVIESDYDRSYTQDVYLGNIQFCVSHWPRAKVNYINNENKAIYLCGEVEDYR